MSKYTPRPDGKPCKHCGRQITAGPYPVHAEGSYAGKSRCDPYDSALPYGYNADPVGAECNGICVGSQDGALS